MINDLLLMHSNRYLVVPLHNSTLSCLLLNVLLNGVQNSRAVGVACIPRIQLINVSSWHLMQPLIPAEIQILGLFFILHFSHFLFSFINDYIFSLKQRENFNEENTPRASISLNGYFIYSRIYNMLL